MQSSALKCNFSEDEDTLVENSQEMSGSLEEEDDDNEDDLNESGTELMCIL